MNNKLNSKIRIAGLIDSKNPTILLNASLPANKTRLLIKWNIKKKHSKMPVMAICIFFPIEEKRNCIN